MLFNCKFHDPRARGYCARAGHISHIVKMFNFFKELLVYCRIKIRQIKTIHVCLLFGIFFIFIFYSYGDVTISSEVLQILIYTRHSWTLSSEGTLACHTYYYNTGHPFIMVISEDPWHSQLLPSSGAVTTCFYDVGLLRQGFENPTFRFRDERSNPLRHRHGCIHM